MFSSSFGIPVERDMHFYLNPRGYGRVPSYAWTNQGPLALPLVSRVRYAMTRGKKFAGALDFGRERPTVCSPVCVSRATAIPWFRCAPTTSKAAAKSGINQQFHRQRARALSLTDAWGNARQIAVSVENNRVTLPLDGLPLYVRFAARRQFWTPVSLDWGANLARQRRDSDAPGARNVAASERRFAPVHSLFRSRAMVCRLRIPTRARFSAI